MFVCVFLPGWRILFRKVRDVKQIIYLPRPEQKYTIPHIHSVWTGRPNHDVIVTAKNGLWDGRLAIWY